MKRHIIKIREIIKTLKSLLATANSSTADFQAKPFLDNIASLKHVPIEEDSNNVFKTFSMALFGEESRFNDIRTQLLSSVNKIFNQFEHIVETHSSLDGQEYINSMQSQSVDPSVSYQSQCQIEFCFLSALFGINPTLIFWKSKDEVCRFNYTIDPSFKSQLFALSAGKFSLISSEADLEKAKQQKDKNIESLVIGESEVEGVTVVFGKINFDISPEKKVIPASGYQSISFQAPTMPASSESSWKNSIAKPPTAKGPPPGMVSKPPPGMVAKPPPGFQDKQRSTMVGNDRPKFGESMQGMKGGNSNSQAKKGVTEYKASSKHFYNSNLQNQIDSSQGGDQRLSLSLKSKVFKPKNPTSIIGGPIPSSFENPSQPIDSEWKQKGKIPPAVSHVTDKKESGRFKFFNEGKSYGFLVSDIDGSDVFFHFDDMKKAGISEDFLRDSKNNFVLRFCFNVMTYLGKYNNSKKAVDLELLTVEPVVDDQAQMPQADYQGIMAPLMNSQ